MPTKALKKNLRRAILVSGYFLFAITCSASTLEQGGEEVEQENSLTVLKQQARDYRDEGFRLQEVGDLEGALKLYQKSVGIDPTYHVVYNDLGVLYEAQGELDQAELSYLKALKIDPYYLSTYSNLALFYEGKRELGKAAYCWKKRVELGDPHDPWTLKARQRLEDIRLTSSQKPVADTQEREVVSLMKDVANEKYVLKHDDKAFARKKLLEAKLNYVKEDYATAIRDALDAQYLDPDNKDIEDFIEKTQSRALTR